MLKVTLEVIIISLKELLKCKLRGLNSLPPRFSSTYVSPDHYIWQHISCIIFLFPLNFVCRKTLLLFCHSFFEQTWKFRCSEMCNTNVGSSGVEENAMNWKGVNLGFTWNQIAYRWSLCVFCNTLKHINHRTLLLCLYIEPLLNNT